MDDRELRRQLMSCIDGTLEDAMYDALGNKINTSTEADSKKTNPNPDRRRPAYID